MSKKVSKPVNTRNISIYVYLVMYAYALKLRVVEVLKNRRAYCSCFSIVLHILRGRYPIEAPLINDTHLTLHSYSALSIVALLHGRNGFEYDINNDTLTILSLRYTTFNKMKVRLYGSINNGDRPEMRVIRIDPKMSVGWIYAKQY